MEDILDLEDPNSLQRWTRELDATEEQLRAALQAVGPKAADVELYLKGSRSATNADKVQEAG